MTFSVVVPAYNSAATLRDALESVLAQTYPPLEIVVVDDGSTDDTAAVAESVGDVVRVVRQENTGTAGARNRGIREARGDLVAFLDADDRYEPTRLDEIARAFAERPELDAVATDALLVSETETRRPTSWWPSHARRDLLDVSAPIIFCSLVIRREVLERLGDFDSRFYLLEDVEFFHRLVCTGHKIGFVETPSYVYHLHGENKTSSRPAAQGHVELVRINVRYALARRTPLRFRPRLAVRALRHARRAAGAWAASR